jgi:hypothetical protein
MKWLIFLIEVTLASVKKKISEEEHEKTVRGEADFLGVEMTPSDFIIYGLGLEEQQ